LKNIAAVISFVVFTPNECKGSCRYQRPALLSRLQVVVNNIIILRELMAHELKIHNRYNLV